jgi:two-component system CheB/CheR fusion protein
MGSDGTLGLRAIKEKAGVVLVQDPATAKFDGMPRSAIDAGLADIVAPVDDLPGRILAYLQAHPAHRPDGSGAGRQDAERLEKRSSCCAPTPAMTFPSTRKTPSIAGSSGAWASTRSARWRLCPLLAGKLAGTGFAFQGVADRRDELLPRPRRLGGVAQKGHAGALASRSPGQVLRAWVPGCSTGEEAYSLAMVFKEAMDKIKPREKFDDCNFATDLDKDAIDKARQGVFPENICRRRVAGSG